MKALAAPTKSQIRRVQEEVWDICMEAIGDNIALVLIVLNEEFGFGEKRLKQFLDVFVATQKEYDLKYETSPVIKECLDTKIKQFGFDRDYVYGHKDIHTEKRIIRLKKESTMPSIAEIYEGKKQIEAMQKLLRGE